MTALELLICIPIAWFSEAIHELGHAVVARWFGVRVEILSLWPLRCYCYMPEIMYLTYFLQVLVLLAGPAVNVGLAGMFAVLDYPPGVWVNLTMAGLNLLPLPILDGGRIWRAMRS